jgi:hypothetical protein
MVVMVGLAGCVGTGMASQFTKPQPYTETGADLNGTDLSETHRAGLREAGSFQRTTVVDFQTEEHALHVNRSAAVEQAANRSQSTSRYNSTALEGDGFLSTTYSNENATYRRLAVDVGNQRVTRYDAASPPYTDGVLTVSPVTASEATQADLIGTTVDDVEWTQRGVKRYDGEWVTRYEAAGSENFSDVSSPVLDAGRTDETDRSAVPEELDVDVRSINATLLVGPDGVVRRLDLRAVGTTGGQSIEMRLAVSTEDVGTTTVEQPDWLDEAQSRTDVTA